MSERHALCYECKELIDRTADSELTISIPQQPDHLERASVSFHVPCYTAFLASGRQLYIVARTDNRPDRRN